MIRGAIIHLLDEQPLLADLAAPPAATDTLLVCTNLRTLDGKRPIFVDGGDSTFGISWRQIRFVEIPAGATEDEAISGAGEAVAEAPLELDEEFLRRIREA